jgi:hypothetical protein
MSESLQLSCDGCGQLASQEHIARRLARLEWTTRYRPVHIGTLLLGAMAPADDADFLYAPDGEFAGEAGIILEAAGITHVGKSVDSVLTEFQRRGLMVTYVLDCPLEPGKTATAEVEALLAARFPTALARIRRSLKPKRLVPISRSLETLVIGNGEPIDLGCVLVLDGQRPLALDDPAPGKASASLRKVLAEAGLARGV